MKTVHVTASRSYDVLIGSGLLSSLGHLAASLGKAKKACIVSDSNVWPLYGETAKESISNAGLEAIEFVFPAGEEHKNGATYLSLLSFLAEHHVTRSDLIVALGGGVVGDLAGFAAATYLRGIRFIQVPTTLLAAVDSSVGGKTAIDLPAGKNLAGAFWQPSMVLCDTDTLSTLPPDVYLDGCAEVIKYAILFDPHLFAHLEDTGVSFDPAAVISRCVELKRDVVAQDEFDRGQRMLLNLGHTFGHAIELNSGYTITHGKAVSIGMAMACRTSHCVDAQRIIQLLNSFGLPVATDIPVHVLLETMLSDKKRKGDTIDLILPERIGRCFIIPTPISRLKSMLQDG